MISRLLIAIALAGLALTATAGTVYKWIDAQGQVHFTDRPPRAADARVIAVYEESSGEAEPTGESPPAEDTPPDTAGGDETSGPAETPPTREQVAAVEQDVAKLRAERCKKAQERYKTYIESQRLYRVGKDGKRQYLTDAELTAARANAKRDVDENCR